MIASIESNVEFGRTNIAHLDLFSFSCC